MKNFLKFCLYVVVSLAIVAVGLYIAFRIYVGAVNVPMEDYQLNPRKVGERIVLPKGFAISIYQPLANARYMLFTETGDLLVANPNRGQITLLERDEDGNGKANGRRILIDSLDGPNGMDFHDGWLYIAETDAVGRVRFDHAAGRLDGDYTRIVKGLPGGEDHWKKTLKFGPDGKLYLSIGSSCNACIEQDKRRAAMLRYNPDGSGGEIYAEGLRNSSDFDWRPADGELYALDNGTDMLGDDFPPEELNRIEKGQHYGWPYANGDRVPHPDFDQGYEEIIENSIPPVHKFRAHNAPLGIVFVRGDGMPEEYRDAAIVALHGSWNRSEKDGYKVVSLHWDEAGNITRRDFVRGFLKDGKVIGRPAAVAEGPDGAIYVADDYAGAVYRIAYGEEQQQLVLPQRQQASYSAEETLGKLPAGERERLYERGKTLFKQYNCIQCHREDDQSLKVLEDLGRKYNLETLPAWLEGPKPPMPIFPLSDAERRALSVYLIETY